MGEASGCDPLFTKVTVVGALHVATTGPPPSMPVPDTVKRTGPRVAFVFGVTAEGAAAARGRACAVAAEWDAVGTVGAGAAAEEGRGVGKPSD